jgi:hypothetical protein
VARASHVAETSCSLSGSNPTMSLLGRGVIEAASQVIDLYQPNKRTIGRVTRLNHYYACS